MRYYEHGTLVAMYFVLVSVTFNTCTYMGWATDWPIVLSTASNDKYSRGNNSR